MDRRTSGVRRCTVPVDPADLRFVLAVSRGGSLLGAARALGVDKATVIRRIDALEESLGAKLVERAQRGWTLTAAGRTAAEAAERIEEEIARLTGAVSEDEGGVVRLTAPAFFARQFLIPEMGRFQLGWPRIELRLLTTNAMLDLGKRDADIAVRNVRPDRGRLVSRPLGRLGHAVYAARSYVERRGAPRTRDDLRAHHLLGYEATTILQPELRWIAESGIPVVLRVTDTLTLLDGVRAGLGIAPLPCCIGEHDRDLVRIDVCGRGRDEICCVYPEDLRETARIRAAVDWLGEIWTRHRSVLEGPSVP
jgi:DNA-binding transcriptional LysR family regulator